jgi:hypothetical protein
LINPGGKIPTIAARNPEKKGIINVINSNYLNPKFQSRNFGLDNDI